MTMKKMELMYKDLHVTYLDMAGNVLDEKAPMGLYDRRFLPDIKMNKYIYDFNDPFLVEDSPSYQCLKKKYVFKKLKAEKAKEKKTKTNYIKEIKTVEKIKEKNYNSYYNGNNKNNIYNNNSTTVTNKNTNNYDYTNDITVSNNKNNIYNNNRITFISNNNNKSFKERKNITNDIYNTDKENMKNINSSVVQNAIKHEEENLDKDEEKSNKLETIEENCSIGDEYEEMYEDENESYKEGDNSGNNNATIQKDIVDNDVNNSNNKYVKSSYVYSSNISGEISLDDKEMK
jgi:hypothetical protein